VPFTEGAQYGIEIFYPYEHELHVTKKKNGEFVFDGEFGPPPNGGLQWPPFRSFGKEFYTYQLLLDLKVGKDWAVRTEPHPRFYTDTMSSNHRRKAKRTFSAPESRCCKSWSCR
jgi:hypothetical protein